MLVVLLAKLDQTIHVLLPANHSLTSCLVTSTNFEGNAMNESLLSDH